MKHKVTILTAVMMLALSTAAAKIETDQTWYMAGEAMGISVTADNSAMAYAELCDRKGIVAGVMIPLNEGKGTAAIELPAALHSGYYVLSAYTRDRSMVSQQLVAVVNPLRKSVDDDIEWLNIAPSDSLSYAAMSSEEAALTEWRQAAGTATALSGVDPSALHEVEGPVVMARVKPVNKDRTYPASEICPSLSIVGKQIHYFEGQMVNDSTAVFYTYGIQGKLPLVLSATTSSGVNLPIEMISPFASLLPKSLPHLLFHYQRSEVEARSLAMQRRQARIANAAKKAQLAGQGEPLTVPAAMNEAEEGIVLGYDETLHGTKPYLSYNLDEYRQFLTIREVLIEYVSFVTSKQVGGVNRLYVRREDTAYNSNMPTLVLIDGVPVTDTEQLLAYDARRIHHINIYGDQYTFGNNIYNGILSFVTRSGRLTNYPLPRACHYLVYDFPAR